VLTRPLERHLDSAEIDALISSPDLVPESGQGAEQALEEARRHLESCEACNRKVQMHMSVQSEISRLGAHPGVQPGPTCPDGIDWLHLVAGMLPEVETKLLMSHAAQCDYCGPLLRKAAESLSDESTSEENQALARLESTRLDWQRNLAKQLSRDVREEIWTDKVRPGWWKGFGSWPRWALGAAMLALPVVTVLIAVNHMRSLRPDEAAKRPAVASVQQANASPQQADQLLGQAYTERRMFEMRIEGASYGPLNQTRGSDQSNSRMNLPIPLLQAEETIARNLKSSPDSSPWLQAAGRANLEEGKYEAALAALQRASRFEPENQAITVDMATAYFMRAEDLHRLEDYGEAVELLGKVAASRPKDSLVIFNYAIALEGAQLFSQAVEEWKKFLSLDADSDWASEARTRLSNLEERLRQKKQRSEEPLKSLDEFIVALGSGRAGSVLDIDARIEVYQDLAVERWLPLAYPNNTRTPSVARVARRALRLLASLLQSHHQDHWLTDLLNQAEAGLNPHKAIASLAEAARLNHTSDRDRATELALEAVELFRNARIPAGESRAQFEAIYAEQLVHQNRHCYQAAQKLSGLRAHQQYVWLQIQVLLESAVCSSMNDERALELVGEARQLAEKHRYYILQLRATTFLAGLSWSTGDPGAAWRYSADGLSHYWAGDYPYIRGYNLYTNLDYLAEDDQKWFLQAAVLREAVQMILNTPDTVLLAVVQGRLGQALFMVGDLFAAEASFKNAEQLFALSPEGSRRRNLGAEAEIGLANVSLRRREAADAVARLEKIRLTISQIPDKDLSLSFFQSLGLAQLNAGRISEAEKTLTLALHLAEEGLGLTSAERKRLEWSRKNEPTYRALVRLTFAEHPEKALAYWESYKGASLRGGMQKQGLRVASPYRASLALPDVASLVAADAAIISYALFDTGTAVWILDTNGIQARWLDSPKVEIESLARRFGEDCSNPSSDSDGLRREALQLYEKLFAPIEPFVHNHKRLVIETDGALDLVPFEALSNGRGAYLADQYSVTFSSGLYYVAAAGPWRRVSSGSRALVVGDPSSPGWPTLQAAEVEAREVAALFRHSRLVLHDDARYETILRELPQAEVFHFAGHAITTSNEAGLVLGGPGVLDVLKMSRLSFRSNKLVVLSACASAQGPTGLFNDPYSTARLLVGAGVPEVVASRWMVDSNSTAALMKEFYGQLFTGKGVGASMQAAAASIRSRPGLSHPFYWASFAVFGRG
jgi:CHAT domain-containing protein